MEFIGVPTEPTTPEYAPQMAMRLDYLRQRGAMADAHNLSIMVIPSDTGIFQENQHSTEKTLTYRKPFTAEEAPHVIWHSEWYKQWFLYGFKLMAYGIALYYYNCEHPEQRGVFELGRNFSSLQLTFETAEENISVYIGRNRLLKPAFFKRNRQAYMSCQATISRRKKSASHHGGFINSRSFDGTDTLYVDDSPADH